MFWLSRMRSVSDAIYLRQGSPLLQNPEHTYDCVAFALSGSFQESHETDISLNIIAILCQ